MPPKRPALGESPFPGMANLPGPVRDLKSRNSFERAATPEYWGLDQANYADLDQQAVDLAAPSELEPSIIGVPRGSHFESSYSPANTRGTLSVALTPVEFGRVTRSVPALGRAVASRTLSGRPARADFVSDQQAATRSGTHALREKLRVMQTYSQTLASDADRLASFTQAAKPGGEYGRAHMPEAEMRMEMTWIQQHIFGDMFLAMRSQRRWTPEQEDVMRRAVDWRLFFDRERNQHLTNWYDMLRLASTYVGHKRGLFAEKIFQARKYISDNAEK